MLIEYLTTVLETEGIIINENGHGSCFHVIYGQIRKTDNNQIILIFIISSIFIIIIYIFLAILILFFALRTLIIRDFGSVVVR